MKVSSLAFSTRVGQRLSGEVFAFMGSAAPGVGRFIMPEA